MSTLQRLSESNMSATKKREIGSKTPTMTAHTPLLNESEQKKKETLDPPRSGSNTLELSDIGQQQRSKSVIRLDKSPTGSTSSYKSSSITGPQETQESMTFAVNEIPNKVSKSTFSGEEHEEEESSTAQFEPPKPKSFKEPDEDRRAQVYQTAICVANSRPNYSPVSPLLPNQTGGWKAVVQKIQNQTNKNMSNPEGQLERIGTPANPKGITMSKGLSSLIEACNVKNSTNFVKVSFQQQLNIPPKSPIGPHGGLVQNISLTSSIGKFNKSDQLTKDPMKEPMDLEKLHKTPSVPSFKDYLQMHKSPTYSAKPFATSTKPSAENLKPPQAPTNKNASETPLRRTIDEDGDPIRQRIEGAQSKALENLKPTPRKEIDEKMKEILIASGVKTKTEKIVGTPLPSKQAFAHQTIISTTFKSPQFHILNQVAMPLNTEKEKSQANLKGFPSAKGSSTRKTHLTPELPIIYEVPEGNLKAKKVVNQYKHDTQQSVKSSQRSGPFDQLDISSESSDSQEASDDNDESSETSEGSGQDHSRQDEISQFQNQNVEKIETTKPRTTDIVQETQVTSQMSEEEGEEEGDQEDSGSGETYYEDEEDSNETGMSEGRETQKVEAFRSACIDDTFREHVINSSQSKAESEYEEETSGDGDDEDSSEYQLTEGEYESTQGGAAQQYLTEKKVGREKYQQINQQLMYRSGVNKIKQAEGNKGYHPQTHEVTRKDNNGSEEDVSGNKLAKSNVINVSNLDEQRDTLFKPNTMSSTDLILKKYSEIEYKVWDLKGEPFTEK